MITRRVYTIVLGIQRQEKIAAADTKENTKHTARLFISVEAQAITGAMKQHIAKNPARTLTGYRVRIFFDNSKNAREMSENIMRTFRMNCPGVPAYRNYQNPFFRVVAGDFRTKSEAMEFLQKIKSSYPSALVVKENIKFPAVDKEHNYVVDTIMVARPAANL